MFSVFFDSEVKGLLRINGNSSCDVCGKAKKICLNASFIVEFYPYDSEHESFCEKINLKCLQPKNCRILFWTKDIISVHLCPKKTRVVRPLIAISQVFLDENTFTLCDDGSNFLLMENENSMHVVPINFTIISGKLCIEQVGNTNMLRLDAKGENSCYFGLYRTDSPFTPIYEGIGDSFLLSGERIQRTKTFHCMSHAKVKNQYYIGDSNYQIESSEILEFDKEYITNACKTLKIFAFMESVRDEIFDICLLLLHEDIRQEFSIEMCKQFFGEFTDIMLSPIHTQENIVAIMCKNSSNIIKVKHFVFEFQNGLICNFSEL